MPIKPIIRLKPYDSRDDAGGRYGRNRSQHTVSFGNDKKIGQRKLAVPGKEDTRGEGQPALSIDGQPILPALWRPKVNPNFDKAKGFDQDELPYVAPRGFLSGYLAKIFGNDAADQNAQFSGTKFASDQQEKSQQAAEKRGEVRQIAAEKREPANAAARTEAQLKASEKVEAETFGAKLGRTYISQQQADALHLKLQENLAAITEKKQQNASIAAKHGIDLSQPDADSKLRAAFSVEQKQIEAEKKMKADQAAAELERTKSMTLNDNSKMKLAEEAAKSKAGQIWTRIGPDLERHNQTGQEYRIVSSPNLDTGEMEERRVPVKGGPPQNLASPQSMDAYKKFQEQLFGQPAAGTNAAPVSAPASANSAPVARPTIPMPTQAAGGAPISFGPSQAQGWQNDSSGQAPVPTITAPAIDPAALSDEEIKKILSNLNYRD